LPSDELQETKETNESQKVSEVAEIEDDNSVFESRKSVLERFSEQMQKRLKESKDPGEVSSSVVAEKLESAAKELGSTLGQAVANKFMNKVLAGTDSAGSPDSLSLAVESFYSEVSSAASENPVLYQKLQEVRQTLQKAAYSEDDLLSGAEQKQDPSEILAAAKDKLFNSYVNARNIGSQTRYYLNNPTGNLINSFA
jgi:hypothetical protein